MIATGYLLEMSDDFLAMTFATTSGAIVAFTF